MPSECLKNEISYSQQSTSIHCYICSMEQITRIKNSMDIRKGLNNQAVGLLPLLFLMFLNNERIWPGIFSSRLWHWSSKIGRAHV